MEYSIPIIWLAIHTVYSIWVILIWLVGILERGKTPKLRDYCVKTSRFDFDYSMGSTTALAFLQLLLGALSYLVSVTPGTFDLPSLQIIKFYGSFLMALTFFTIVYKVVVKFFGGK